MLSIKLQSENGLKINNEMKQKIIDSVTYHLEQNWDEIVSVEKDQDGMYVILIEM